MGPKKSEPVEEPRVNPDDLDEIDSLFFDADGETQVEAVIHRTSRIVALVSPKGGTGKTSIAIMLAGCLQSPRRKTGVMDLDPSRGVDRWARAADGLPFPTFAFTANLGAAAFRRSIREAMAQVDLLILDTPPAMTPAIRLTMQVADLVLVPAGASTLDLEAAQQAIEAARQARHGRTGDLPEIVVVPSRLDARTRIARDFARRFEELQVAVTPSVGQRVEVAAAANSGRLVRPNTVAGQEFRTLARHVWALLRELDA